MPPNQSPRSASVQARNPIAKKPSSSSVELSRTGKSEIDALCAERHLTYYDPRISAIATALVDPTLSQELTQKQGAIEDWTEFAPGLSLRNYQRWRSGCPVSSQSHVAFCQALAIVAETSLVPSTLLAPDPTPYFKALYRCNRKRIEAIAQGLRFEDSMLTQDWAVGPTWEKPIPADNLSIHPTKNYSVPYNISALVRNLAHQVGVVVVEPSGSLKPIVDGRLYLWLGKEAVNGRKVIRTVKFEGDVEAGILDLLNTDLPLKFAV